MKNYTKTLIIAASIMFTSTVALAAQKNAPTEDNYYQWGIKTVVSKHCMYGGSKQSTALATKMYDETQNTKDSIVKLSTDKDSTTNLFAASKRDVDNYIMVLMMQDPNIATELCLLKSLKKITKNNSYIMHYLESLAK